MRQPEINYAPPVYKKQEKNESKNYSISSVEKEPLFSPPRTILKDENAEHKNYSIDNMPTIDKKMVKRRYLDIGSHSLRNLRKEFETKEDDLDQEAREKAVNSLNDWINRRITGYLIFQNTVSAGKGEDKLAYKEMGVHLNSVAGQKWKGLPEEEKEEYKMLAKYYRRIFRDEIYTYENYDDFTSLIEKLDIKIKKLKKE